MTEGYARFTAQRESVKVVLLARVPASHDRPVVATLELTKDATSLATLHVTRTPGVWDSAEALEQAWHGAIDRANDPKTKDLSRRQTCRVLPSAGSDEPGRGQQCDWVPTTPEEREALALSMRERADKLRAWVTENRERLHKLTMQLFPYGDDACLGRLTQGHL